MKVDFRHLILAYSSAFTFCTFFFLAFTTECKAYWMHDASIEITHRWLIGHFSFIFLLPILILFAHKYLQIKTPIKLFVAHLFISLTSISLLAIAINKPCEYINGGHYMFIDSFLTLGFYLFKLISFILIIVIIVMTANAITRQKKGKLE